MSVYEPLTAYRPLITTKAEDTPKSLRSFAGTGGTPTRPTSSSSCSATLRSSSAVPAGRRGRGPRSRAPRLRPRAAGGASRPGPRGVRPDGPHRLPPVGRSPDRRLRRDRLQPDRGQLLSKTDDGHRADFRDVYDLDRALTDYTIPLNSTEALRLAFGGVVDEAEAPPRRHGPPFFRLARLASYLAMLVKPNPVVVSRSQMMASTDTSSWRSEDRPERNGLQANPSCRWWRTCGRSGGRPSGRHPGDANRKADAGACPAAFRDPERSVLIPLGTKLVPNPHTPGPPPPPPFQLMRAVSFLWTVVISAFPSPPPLRSAPPDL